MTFKPMLVAAASALSVSPAFALSRSQIIHHTGGPIPYSELAGSSGASASQSQGYNTRPATSGAQGNYSGPAGQSNSAAQPGLDNNGVNGAAGANPAPAPGSEGSAGAAPTGGANTPTAPGTTGAAPGSAGASTGAQPGGAAPQ